MSSIKKDITQGIFWIALAKYSGIIIQLVISAILARKISPSAFGTVAIAMVVLHFLSILADIGIGPAVVQYKQLTKSHLNSLFTLTAYLGLLLTLGLYFLSGAISDYYNDNILERICQLMSVVIIFNSFNVVPNALMRKDKRFRTIAFRTLFFRIASGTIAVWGAFNGWGIYALLVSPIMSSIGVFCVNYYNYPLRFVSKISREAFNIVASFSFFQFAFTFCNYFSRNLDKLIIGRYFSMTQLGYYEKSYHLMMLPVQNLSFVITPVLHPILSTLQNNKHNLKEKNKKLAVMIANISFPIGLMLYFCGGELIKIVYGNQWAAAIPVFRILALSLPLQMILSTNVSFFQAAGKTKYLFFSGILNTTCTVTGFIIAVFWGNSIEAVACSWDITLIINFVNTYLILHRFAFREPCTSFYKSLLPQAVNSLLTWLIIEFIVSVIPEFNIFCSLLYKLLLVFLINVTIAVILRQYSVRDLVSRVKKRTL